MEQNKDKLKAIKQEVYLLFKNNEKNEYTNPDWIFPHHFDVMADLVEDMCKKYGGNLTICTLAVYLHDVGLVYQRKEDSPVGHEERSIEYSEKLLRERGLSGEVVKEVIECINQTSLSDDSASINAKIVNTADAVSKFITLHYFAKSSFFGNWDFFYSWARKKLEKSLKKIHFEQEREMVMPIYN